MQIELLNWLDEWTFKESGHDYMTQNIHAYPARFIPSLAEKLIKTYSEKYDVIFDPFCGSGTSMLVSQLNQRAGFGCDLNPLAILIAKVKTTPISEDSFDRGVEYLRKELRLAEEKYNNPNHHVCVPLIKNIDYWFSREALQAICLIRFALFSYYFIENFRNLALVSLSDILRKISFVNDKGWKMHRDKKKLDKNWDFLKIKKLFLKKLKQNFSLLQEFENKIKEDKEFFKYGATVADYWRPDIALFDSRKSWRRLGAGSVDFVLTSPPYGDSQTTVAYGQFSRLSCELLGLEPLGGGKVSTLDNELLGGHGRNIGDSQKILDMSVTLRNIVELFTLRNSVRDNKRLKDILSFYYDLFLVLKNCKQKLKKGGYMAFVVASRIVHNVKLPVDVILGEFASSLNLKFCDIFFRDIIKKRVPVIVNAENKTGSKAMTMTEEMVVILKKV